VSNYTRSQPLPFADAAYKEGGKVIIMDKSNSHDTREAWLRAATNELRPYFASCGMDLSEKLRFAIAFTSTGRKGTRRGMLTFLGIRR
jgi:hypothetical protein